MLMLAVCAGGMGILCEGTPDTGEQMAIVEPLYSIINQRTDCHLQPNVLNGYVPFTRTRVYCMYMYIYIV